MPEIQNLSLLSVPTEATLLQAITISLLYYYNSNLPNLALQSMHDLVVTSLLNPSVGPSRASTGTPRTDQGPHRDPTDRPGPHQDPMDRQGPHQDSTVRSGPPLEPHTETRPLSFRESLKSLPFPIPRSLFPAGFCLLPQPGPPSPSLHSPATWGFLSVMN